MRFSQEIFALSCHHIHQLNDIHLAMNVPACALVAEPQY